MLDMSIYTNVKQKLCYQMKRYTMEILKNRLKFLNYFYFFKKSLTPHFFDNSFRVQPGRAVGVYIGRQQLGTGRY